MTMAADDPATTARVTVNVTGMDNVELRARMTDLVRQNVNGAMTRLLRATLVSEPQQSPAEDARALEGLRRLSEASALTGLSMEEAARSLAALGHTMSRQCVRTDTLQDGTEVRCAGRAELMSNYCEAHRPASRTSSRESTMPLAEAEERPVKMIDLHTPRAIRVREE
jgi:hypothetical protein